MPHPVHQPYVTTTPFSIGLRPITPDHLIEVDDALGRDLALKTELYATDEAAVFRAEPETVVAQGEALDAVLACLKEHHRDLYEIDETGVTIGPTGTRHAFQDFAAAPLKLASLLVQEDLCLMRKGAEGWRLAAASVCFPSSWSLADKFSKPMSAIHDPVPGFAGRMLMVVERIFDNLQIGQAVERFNWSLYTDSHLRHPEPHPELLESLNEIALAERLTVRVERQTLSRLPESGDVLFTIRIHVDRVDALRHHPDREKLAGALKEQVLAMTAEQRRYKGLTVAAERVAAVLDRIASAA